MFLKKSMMILTYFSNTFNVVLNEIKFNNKTFKNLDLHHLIVY